MPQANVIFKHKNIVSIGQLDKDDILHILETAALLKRTPRPDLLAGHILANCFFEPSTRTRLSFACAMHRLGGEVLGFAEAAATSTAKGESLSDTMRMVSAYADIVAVRHPCDGAAALAAEACAKPVINAGDGANEHPTQTLLDLFAIEETQSGIENLNIALVGDLKFSRTVHSLAQACALFNTRLYFVSPEQLELPKAITEHLKQQGVKFSCHRCIEDIIGRADILYMTRLQTERMYDSMTAMPELCMLTPPLLRKAKKNMRILHPLPRQNELPPAIDASKHAYYFQQAADGVFVRQALLGLLSGKL